MRPKKHPSRTQDRLGQKKDFCFCTLRPVAEIDYHRGNCTHPEDSVRNRMGPEFELGKLGGFVRETQEQFPERDQRNPNGGANEGFVTKFYRKRCEVRYWNAIAISRHVLVIANACYEPSKISANKQQKKGGKWMFWGMLFTQRK